MTRRCRTDMLVLTILLAGGAAQAQAPARGNPAQRASALCSQADEEQHAGELAPARAHLEEGLAALGALETAAARRARLSCTETLAFVLAAQGDLRGAWARMVASYAIARNLPPAAWAGLEPAMLDLSGQVWSGAACAEGLDHANLELAEVSALQSLARADRAPVRACLTAVRARLARDGGGACRAVSALPQGTPAITDAAWRRVDPQAAVYADGESVFVAHTTGGATRYTMCHTGLTEAQQEAYEGYWLTPGALVVTSRVRPCGEDGDARRCPPETLAWVLDAQGGLLGHYTIQRSPLIDRGPLAQPMGSLPSPRPFRVERGVVLAGTRPMRVAQGALAAAP